ncbi:protein ABHD11 [Coffea eugenioides]|uniref:protein ABHD11 n=1 Tax=Coffea eugenioides TaxID=49369 RepID=UPI000F60AC79|nr:protein ABHD11 [Coffea eugenioides]
MSRTLSLVTKPGSKLLNRFLILPCPNPILHQSSRTLETLAFEEVLSSPDKPYTYTAFILHGLLGSGRNWRSFSRSLASSLSGWRMVMVDLRNHGKSAEITGLSPPHTIGSAARDLADLVKSKGWDWPDVVIGHSLGGKVALDFARSCARGDYGEHACLLKQLWVLDSVPGKVDPEESDGEVEQVLQTLQCLPSSIPSRKWLVDHMMKRGFSKALSEWIGSNLKRSGDQETWAFNFEGAIQMFNSYRETDYWSLLDEPPKGMEIAIVRAENSDRWTQDTIQRIQRLAAKRVDEADGKVSYHVLSKSGHWVHVDNPKGLLQIVTPELASIT